MGVNKVILVGNVGKDPEVRYFENGAAVANFTLATSETYTKDGERVTTTEWHNVSVWRKTAEVVEKYVKKGTQLYVEGKLRTRSYDDKDGNKRYVTEIVGDRIQLLGSKPDGTQQAYSDQSSSQSQAQSQAQSTPQVQENQSYAQSASSSEDDMDDLPF